MASVLDIPITEKHSGHEQVNTRLVAALHEISHCVVAETSGLRTSDIWIKRQFFGGGCEGATSIDLGNTAGVYIDPDDPRMYHVEDEHVHAFLLTCIAGWRGVAHWFRELQGDEQEMLGITPDYGCRSDFRMFDCVNRGEGAGLSRHRAATAADRIIAMHWSRITTAAGQLYTRKRMDASKVVSASDRARAAATMPKTPEYAQ